MKSPYHTLCAQKDFIRVYKAKNAIRDRFFRVYIAKNSLRETRIGISVSVRCAPRAVKRNRTRRVIKEATRDLLPRIQKGQDIIIVCEKAQGWEKKRNVVKETLKKLFLRGGIFVKAI